MKEENPTIEELEELLNKKPEKCNTEEYCYTSNCENKEETTSDDTISDNTEQLQYDWKHMTLKELRRIYPEYVRMRREALAKFLKIRDEAKAIRERMKELRKKCRSGGKQ
ncbi:MAG: hypothetical protein ACTSYD_02325 [Candidatus Heimdallarchaeaceae archaeon]